MRFIFPAKPHERDGLRAGLFVDTLRQYLVKSPTHQIVDETETPIDADILATFDTLGALDPGRHAETSVFIGLPATPHNMTGRNILVCPRPLNLEFEAFAERFEHLDAISDLWPLNVISAFEKTVFLERHDLQESHGFATWTKLALADRFPLLLPAQTAESQDGIALFMHSNEVGDVTSSELRTSLSSLGQVTEITDATSPDQLSECLAQCAVHVHFGWSPKSPTIGLSPFDSLSSGTYTLVTLPENSRLELLGNFLLQWVNGCPLAEISNEPDQWSDLVKSMLDRAKAYKSGIFRINPEMARQDSANLAFITEAFKRFENQVSL